MQLTTVVLASCRVANVVQGGGHFWVYMQYAHALRQLGCNVYWLEHVRTTGDDVRDAAICATFRDRLARFGLGDHLIFCKEKPQGEEDRGGPDFLGIPTRSAESILHTADLLLNFYYAMPGSLVRQFRRTALVDIDPGLFQFWLSRAQLPVAPHHVHFTTGETVGKPGARFPDCGLRWHPIRPPVCLDLWTYTHDERCQPFTTVSNWRGEDWLEDGDALLENTKGVSFLEFAHLPRMTPQVLELALSQGRHDGPDMHHMESMGWRIRRAYDVAGTPEDYLAYIRSSRGEFSCAKPSCMRFQNAWVSDRTLCYLASGKPVVVQDTGPSAFLPNGEGMFRFSTPDEAVAALAAVNSDYKRHCRAAREIAEAILTPSKPCKRSLSGPWGSTRKRRVQASREGGHVLPW